MAFGNMVLGSAISAIVGIIGLLIYVTVFSAFNTSLLAAADLAMLGVIPTILAAVIVVSIVVLGFSMISR